MTPKRAPKTPLGRGLLMAAAMGFVSFVAASAKPPDSVALEAKVLALIGDAACESHEQCRTVAFGAKACGGPQSYLAWSTLRTDEAALKMAAEKFAARRRDEIKDSGIASNCALVADPGAYCAPAATAASGTTAGPPRVCRLRSVRPGGSGPAAD